MHAKLKHAETYMNRLQEEKELLLRTRDQLALQPAGTRERGGKLSEKLMKSVQRRHIGIPPSVYGGTLPWCLCEIVELHMNGAQLFCS